VRTIWKGSLVFGRIGIPVGLAVTHADGDPAFRMLHRDCSTPLSLRRWCPTHDREVAAEEIVRGWEVAPGQFVLVEDTELEAIAPEADRTIEIAAFVDADEIDPLWRDRAYYLAPSEHGVRHDAYVVLGEAMQETDTVALVRLVAWNSEHLCAIRPAGDPPCRALVLETLRYPADIVPVAPIEDTLAGVESTSDELSLAVELLSRLLVRVGKVDLGSRHRERVLALLEDKLAGREIVRPATAVPVETEPPGAELAEALRRSIRRAPRRRRQPAKAR